MTSAAVRAYHSSQRSGNALKKRSPRAGIRRRALPATADHG
jgi:hypothetical protein